MVSRMVLPLDFLLLVVITILTITLLLVNYVAYLSRGRKIWSMFRGREIDRGGRPFELPLGTTFVDLGQQYGTIAILSR